MSLYSQLFYGNCYGPAFLQSDLLTRYGPPFSTFAENQPFFQVSIVLASGIVKIR